MCLRRQCRLNLPCLETRQRAYRASSVLVHGTISKLCRYIVVVRSERRVVETDTFADRRSFPRFKVKAWCGRTLVFPTVYGSLPRGRPSLSIEALESTSTFSVCLVTFVSYPSRSFHEGCQGKCAVSTACVRRCACQGAVTQCLQLIPLAHDSEM